MGRSVRRHRAEVKMVCCFLLSILFEENHLLLGRLWILERIFWALTLDFEFHELGDTHLHRNEPTNDRKDVQ